MTRGAAQPAVTALAVGAAVGAAALTWGTLVERNRFTVRHEVLPVLGPDAHPLRVLHLSDLHMAPWQHRKQEWVRSLARFEPDLVVNTGDNLGHRDGIEGVERALEPFAGIPGVYVNGSNDYFAPLAKNPFGYFAGPSAHPGRATALDIAGLEAVLADRLGWFSLNNRAHSVELKGSRIEFFGVNDAHRGWDRLDLLPAAIEEMRETLDSQEEGGGPDAVAIGVTHAPYRRVLDSFVTHGARVVFAGHTHGGQVRIPGLPPLVTNCDIPRGQAQGVSVWHHARRAAFLEVSAGIGTSIYAPVRFACPPEAVIVTLTAGDIGYP